MPNSESLPADGEQTTPIIIPSDTEEQFDPLLGSGSFIDPNNGRDQKKAEIATTPDPVNEKKTRPSWLPEDWDITFRKRTSGATQGSVDRYFISPSGRRLRSKNEVLNFLETGSKRKKPPAQSSDDITWDMGDKRPVTAPFTASFFQLWTVLDY